MERYRFLEHTADGRFQAFGATLEEAFGNAALAAASLMWDWTAVDRRTDVTVELDGRDPAQLLVRFLNEILYLFETRRFLLAAVERVEIGPAREIPPVREEDRAGGPVDGAARPGGGLRLTAVLCGDALSGRYGLHGDVKAATYNDLKIESRAGGGFVVQVVVDL